MLLKKTACVDDGCGSSDALAVYVDDHDGSYSATCFSCNQSWQNNQLCDTYLADEFGITKIPYGKEARVVQQNVQQTAGRQKPQKKRKEAISSADLELLYASCVHDATGYRNLSKQVNEKYGVLSRVSDVCVEDPSIGWAGKISHRYYPIYEEGVVVGYKGREVPKAFFSKGRNDNQCMLFGQQLFPHGGKYLLIVGGEEDALAAYEMLRADQIRRGKDIPPIAVVSPTTGETSCVKQLQHNYEWLEKFENIILMFDNDDAGREATELALEAMPIGRAKVATLQLKDPVQMKLNRRETDFVRSFYDAKKPSPAGVVGSDKLYEAIIAKAGIPKVPFPGFLHELQTITAGGIPLKAIVNIIAGSGVGKTTWINALVYHWIFHSPYKVGIISLEADCAEYGSYLLSSHLGNKLAMIEDPVQLKAYLNSDYVKQKAENLFSDEDGDPRFYLIDDRGDFGGIQKRIEQLIVSCGVQLIVIDPLSDLMAGMDVGEQELFMAWMKQMTKAYDVSFFNVNHTRKGKDMGSAASRGADLSEEDIIGSSTIYKSASLNITLVRNKHAEDPVERNTTKVTLTKNRPTGITGPAGKVYYDNRTHSLMSLQEYELGAGRYDQSDMAA